MGGRRNRLRERRQGLRWADRGGERQDGDPSVALLNVIHHLALVRLHSVSYVIPPSALSLSLQRKAQR